MGVWVLTSAIGWIEDHNGIGLSVDYNLITTYYIIKEFNYLSKCLE